MQEPPSRARALHAISQLPSPLHNLEDEHKNGHSRMHESGRWPIRSEDYRLSWTVS